jgi:hypothetical protein
MKGGGSMATNNEMRANQKSELFRLLELKKINEVSGNKIDGIERLILTIKAPMEAEDVAYVEKLIAQL